ncbi:hypothetical protein BGZ65_001691 [Modicella reniformis]|uniref:Uncharacterized protein n=1 Tax=Modicella reniformis TaxID=1440133 RepID=A0A9P6MJG0_9FUNG|nr:hypothetical protein BGZ65_001691 [Modicella reniformis]
MLSASLASSATTHARTPLNVVFIIDTYLPQGVDEAQSERAVTFLKRSLVRILLYFQCNMDAKFQWTYQFFNSRLNQDIGLISNRILRNLNISTVAACINEYRKIIAAETPSAFPPGGKGSTSTTGTRLTISPCYNLRRQLVHSLADFGLDIASYQSPVKANSSFVRSQSLQKHFPPVSVRNYMYILSPLPRTWTETVTFLEGKPHSQNDRPMLGPRKSDILEVLKGIKDAFFTQGLWDRFLDQRTGLSWIDTSVRIVPDEPSKTQTRVSATTMIRSTLELIMKSFGGHIIPQHMICQTLPPRDVYSFPTIFQMYRSLQIQPGLGVKMSRDSWQALLSVPFAIHSEDIRPVKVMWSGNVLCAESSQFICSLDIAEPQSSSNATALDQIESLLVIKRVPSRTLSTRLHSIRLQNAMTCFPRYDNEKTCERALYLLKSLEAKKDILLLKVSFQREEHDPVDQEQVDESSASRQYTHHAVLHPTIAGSGIIEILDSSLDLQNIEPAIPGKISKARPFSLAMMDRSLSKLGAFVDQVDPINLLSSYQLDEMPSSILRCLKPLDTVSAPIVEAKPLPTKPLPGETVGEMEAAIVGPEMAESIDELCLNIRKTYLKYLYRDEHNVSDYVKRLNAASKEITVLAAKQSVALKEAQQKLVAFIIEFLRICPSRMGSKYKQIDKEVNAGKSNDSKSQDHYVVLEDERSELDAWTAQVMRSVKDTDVRMHLKKLKTKDIQIQIIQNLHVLLLVNKYGLEENKPFKKDPGALKTVTLFMDELCIAASLENMDSAKKFFTRIIARYYELSLPKVVEKLSIKCGVEKSLLSSPRPFRGSKHAGIKRSISMGLLQKPSPLDFSAAMENDAGGSISSTPKTHINGVAPKGQPSLTRRSTSDNPAKNILNSTIFRNRQVVMTLGSVKGVGVVSTTSAPSTTTTKGPVATSKSQPEMEDEDAPPKLAKLKLKKFYHDKESEEVLKLFRRQQPLSKQDAVYTSSQINTKQENNKVEDLDDDIDDDDDSDDSDDELGTLGKYLRRKGTTSWGVIKSVNVSSSRILRSPSSGAAQRRGIYGNSNNSIGAGPTPRRNVSPSPHFASMVASSSLLSDSVVPSTPTSKQGYQHYDQGGYDSPQKSPSTPSGRAQFRRHGMQNVQDLTALLPRRRSREDVLVEGRPTTRRREA